MDGRKNYKGPRIEIGDEVLVDNDMPPYETNGHGTYHTEGNTETESKRELDNMPP